MQGLSHAVIRCTLLAPLRFSVSSHSRRWGACECHYRKLASPAPPHRIKYHLVLDMDRPERHVIKVVVWDQPRRSRMEIVQVSVSNY
jgi:hypothetical protein